jgi:hypothetical protein
MKNLKEHELKKVRENRRIESRENKRNLYEAINESRGTLNKFDRLKRFCRL